MSCLQTSPLSGVALADHAWVPAVHAWLLVELAHEHGLDTRALLSDIGLGGVGLDDPDHWLTLRQFNTLMQWTRNATGLASLGCEMGLRTPATVHGLFGLGVLSSASPQEALELAARYSQLRNPTFGVNWSVQGPEVVVHLVDFMPDLPMRQSSTEWLLLSMVRMAQALLAPCFDVADPAPGGHLSLQVVWPQPPYHAAYADRLPPCRFHAPETAIRFPSSWLTQKLAGSAAASVQLARRACERDLVRLKSPASTVWRVRSLLDGALARGQYPSRHVAAERLNVAVGTLKRQLAQEGSSFSALLNDVRWRDARRLLSQGGVTVADVAVHLGYQNTANFTRAFRQWSSMTPSQWRASTHAGTSPVP